MFAHKIERFHLKCPFSLHSNLSSTSTGKVSTRTEFLNLNGTSNIPDQLGKLHNEYRGDPLSYTEQNKWG